MTMKDSRLAGLWQNDDFLISNRDLRGTSPAAKVA